MYDLSICLTALRKHNWKRLYDSIATSIGDYSFELILCGPHEDPPEEMQDLPNVKCIQDYGSPTRCQQRAMLAATGRYITWAADDGWYMPEDPKTVSLGQCIHHLDTVSEEKKCLVTRYNEGVGDGLGDPASGMYCLNFHDPVRSPHYPDHFLIFNCAILPTVYFKELGGFDCQFEVCPMAFCDFGARAQLDGATVILTGLSFECTHFPGTDGDHAPVHHAQIDHDQPLYEEIWQQATAPDRIKIDINNWEEHPDLWERRFGDLTQEED